MITSWRSAYTGLVEQGLLDSMQVSDHAERWLPIITRQAHSTGVYVLDEPGAGVVGFASGGRERDLDPTYRGELYSLYVLDSHQGRGHGAALVAAVAAWLAEHRMASMLVWVLRENHRARGFYEHLGGSYVRHLMRRVGEVDFDEVSYGWLDTGSLLRSG